MKKLILSLMLISNIALAQSPSIVFPVQYTINRELSSSDVVFGGILFEVVPARGNLNILKRSFAVFEDEVIVENESAFTTSELFFRESYFEHVILRKKVEEDQFRVVFEGFESVLDDHRCANFTLTPFDTGNPIRIWACFNGEEYVIRRLSESVVTPEPAPRSRVVVFDLVSG